MADEKKTLTDEQIVTTYLDRGQKPTTLSRSAGPDADQGDDADKGDADTGDTGDDAGMGGDDADGADDADPGDSDSGDTAA